jgi:hypothetical protein
MLLTAGQMRHPIPNAAGIHALAAGIFVHFTNINVGGHFSV